ncbi:MAG: hypothetical protein KDM63_13355, partial [Verrucomicrobiae bacterium]|nr:hypothetical protein [Verrucomicrobiae bacterium]
MAAMFPQCRVSLSIARFLILASVGLVAPIQAFEPVKLPGEPKNGLPIVIEAPPSETNETIAKALAEKLAAIFSVPFPITTEATGSAIRLRLAPLKSADGPGPFERETYSIRTAKEGIILT